MFNLKRELDGFANQQSEDAQLPLHLAFAVAASVLHAHGLPTTSVEEASYREMRGAWLKDTHIMPAPKPERELSRDELQVRFENLVSRVMGRLSLHGEMRIIRHGEAVLTRQPVRIANELAQDVSHPDWQFVMPAHVREAQRRLKQASCS